MKRAFRIAALLFIICVLASFLTVSAVGQRVFDDAGLFDETQITGLESKVAVLIDEIGMDVVVHTTYNAEGKTSQDYADDYFDYGGFGTGSDRSGVLFLIDMDNREVYISTRGDMIKYLTDSRIESILDAVFVGIENRDFYSATETFLGEIKHYVEAGIPSDQYTYDTDTGEIIRERVLTVKEILIFLAIAVGVGLLACLFVAGKYKMMFPAYTYPFREKCGMLLTSQDDIFINMTHTQHRIQTSSSGGSGSGTHRSSSGARHGGGGRKF